MLWVVFLLLVVLEFLVIVSIVVVVVMVGFWLMWGELVFLFGLFVLLLVLEFYVLLCNMGMVYYLCMEVIGVVECMV